MYNFDEIIDRRNTNSAKYDEARFAEDPDLISMWVADMDFKVHEAITKAMIHRIEHGVFGYHKVSDQYYQSVIDWMQRRHHFTVEKEWIVPFPGIVPALRVCLDAFSHLNDQVVILKPVYYPFDLVVEQAGRKIRPVELVYSDGTYHLDFDSLEKALQEPMTKMMFLCSPHNPLAISWSNEELERIARLCLENEVILISDEIHMDFDFTEKGHISVYNALEEAKKNTVICTAPSKTFNLAALSVSNIIIANPKLREGFKTTMSTNGVSTPNVLALTACQAAYESGDEWVDELKEYLRANYTFMKEWFKENLPMVTLSEQQALYLVWADFRAFGLDEKALEDFMLHKAHLWLDEGYIFGEGGKGFERFNIACPRSVLKEALERIKKAAIEQKLITA